MEPDFWHRKWENNEIGFHEGKVNPLLVKHFPALALAEGKRVFVPLCGKTLDIHWLLSRDYRVAGAELSQLAVEQLFAELGVEPEITPCGPLRRYSADGVDIFVGDIFELSPEALGPVDAIYDRAALVALPEAMRVRYTAHLMQLTARAPQLLLCFEYDQRVMAGPPFSITPEEVQRHYAGQYALTHLERVEVPGGFRGKVSANESAWLLQR